MRSGWRLVVLAVLAVTPFRTSGAQKSKPSGYTPFVLIDVVPAEEDNPVSTRIFSLTEEDDEPIVLQAISLVQSLHASDSVGAATRLFRFLRENGEALAAHSSNRWESHQGDSIHAIVLRPAGQITPVEFEESPRQSRLSADLDSLVEIAGVITKRNFTKGPGPLSFTRAKYRLRNNRGFLKITARQELEDSTESSPLSTSLITGPSERVFLSADAAFTKLRQVRYNTETNEFEPGHKPTELLIGLNYSLHDLFENANAAGLKYFVQGMYLGFLVEPTKRPFNQIGATVGFRHSPPPFESLFSLETVSPYFGLIWARDDVPDPGASTQVKTRYGRPAMIFGLALGLDKALGWVERTQ
jgi:hypothetical protein